MYRLFHNKWIVTGGVGVIAVGTIFASICSANLGDTSGASTVRNQRVLDAIERASESMGWEKA